MSNEIITIEILNWNKYNSENFATKYPHWVRLQNDFYTSESLFALSHLQKYVWICTLCYASKKKSNRLPINLRWFSLQVRVRQNQLYQAFKKMADARLVVLNAYNPRTDGVLQTDITDRQTVERRPPSEKETKNPSFPFGSLIQFFPNRIGADLGIKACHEKIKTEEEFENLKKAVKNYSEHVRGFELKYIMQFDNFILKERWKEFVTPPNTPPKKQGIVL